jgi:hypothetical protein
VRAAAVGLASGHDTGASKQAAPNGDHELIEPDRLAKDAADVHVREVVATPGHDHDGNGSGRDLRGNFLLDAQPPEHRQTQIEQDEIRDTLLEPPQRGDAIAGFVDVEPVELECETPDRAQVEVVLDYQDDSSLPHLYAVGYPHSQYSQDWRPSENHVETLAGAACNPESGSWPDGNFIKDGMTSSELSRPVRANVVSPSGAREWGARILISSPEP